jgi:hypothetical protein
VLAKDLIDFLDEYGFKDKIITHVKNEGLILSTMTSAFKFVMKCEGLGLEESFQGTCFGHVFSKAYQYATNDEKVCMGLKYISINFAQEHV